MDDHTSPSFKVIIVGAGIAGLVLANILKRASIDFVVLEAHEDFDKPVGGSYGLWPNAARILDQIDCWDDVLTLSASLKASYTRLPNGSAFMTSHIASRIATL